ncbi:glycosyltransferase family 4 protein [Acidimangrovimonas sediminis]|uniref:glycosyltransferase family 4 protein n=1 Tax=Acidimangrovimonas sediminis TaxID=2056283 RepID=UPI000C807052|nr:glycosyltransferase family 4 protein [Acidimangrovimonas sediminis]
MTGQPRILFLALDTFSQMGGIQRFNQRILETLDKRRAAGLCHVSCHVMRDTAADIPAGLAPFVTAFGPDRFGFLRRSFAAARRHDILIVGHINLLPVAWGLKRLNPRLKLVMFVHGAEAWDDPIYRVKRRYEPFMLRSVDRIASVSDYTARIMAMKFDVPPSKFALFPNTVDGPVDTARTPAEAPRILAVSRMAGHDRAKHLDTLIRAMAELPTELAGARLDIIGDGVLRPELETLCAELGQSHRITFHGRVDDAALLAAYEGARVFALPSAKEGFGIVYLEAWRYALPVICSTRGASTEIVTDGLDGYAVDPTDHALLARRLAALLGDYDLARRLGQAGARKLAEHYLRPNLEANLGDLLTSCGGEERMAA